MRKQSKEIFAESLISLMDKSSYNVITISEICDNTPLTRRTFYNNFSSKEDVVKFICENLIEEYLELLNRESNLTVQKVSEIFCRLGAANKDIFLLLMNNKIYFYFVEVCIKNIDRMFCLLPYNIDNLSETHRKYILLLHAVSGANLFEQWLTGGMKESPDEMSQIYSSFVRQK